MLRSCRAKKMVLVFCMMILMLTGCHLPKPYEISPNFTREKYRSIGLLIVRMGNYYPGTPALITLKTDYSVRTPKTQSTLGLSEDKVDVCIEDESLIQKSLPDYPNFKTRSTPKTVAKYFKNITPRLYQNTLKVLSRKGYRLFDIRQLSNAWSKNLYEMTVNEMIDELKGKVDAILIIHYTDIGDYYMNAVNIILDSKGFSWLDYTMSMFDVSTKERIMNYTPSTVLIAKAMLNDVEIPPDAGILQKIKINEKNIPLGFYNRYDLSKMVSIDKLKIRYDFSDDEIIRYAMKYFSKGISYETESGFNIDWKGLDEVIP